MNDRPAGRHTNKHILKDQFFVHSYRRSDHPTLQYVQVINSRQPLLKIAATYTLCNFYHCTRWEKMPEKVYYKIDKKFLKIHLTVLKVRKSTYFQSHKKYCFHTLKVISCLKSGKNQKYLYETSLLEIVSRILRIQGLLALCTLCIALFLVKSV